MTRAADAARRHRAAALLACCLSAAPAHADPGGPCYDLKVIARPVAQVPSELPECADCIFLRWPWFLDLAVRRIEDGAAPAGPLSVLAVQHTRLRPVYRLWLLRRNDAGGYNVVAKERRRSRIPRCPADAAPDGSYLAAPDGGSLADLRAAGERRYGRYLRTDRARRD